VDTPTKFAFVVLSLLTIGAIWWYVADELRQRRRARAEAWAREQMSPDEPPVPQQIEELTVPLDLSSTEELEDGPDLVRPFMQMEGYTDVFPRIGDHTPRPPGM
jgi:hypothetical protein